MPDSAPTSEEPDGGPQLPPAVAAAWGLTPAPRRGPRAALSVDAIVRTALRIGDEHGLAAVSMTRVAEELGFTTMSLYRHVGSKDELLTHVQDAALGPAPDDLDGMGWRTALATWTHRLLDAYAAHPWTLDIPIPVPPMMPRTIEWMDRALGAMAGLELSPAEKVSTTLLLSGYARNEATLSISIAEAEAGGPGPATDDRDYEAVLQLFADPERLPALSAILRDGSLFDHPYDDGPDNDGPNDDGPNNNGPNNNGPNDDGPNNDEPEDQDEFFLAFGLARILDGIEAHIARRHD